MRQLWQQLTRCASSRPCVTGRLRIQQQSYMWYFNWHIELLEMRFMRNFVRNMNWVVTAVMAIGMTAAAPQAPSEPQKGQTVSSTQPSSSTAQAAPVNLGPPSTMDQVVDRVIMRENGLIKFLSPRTPIVETYLQNLTQDTQLGPVPQDDHYFLGRMDLSDSIDSSDYLQDNGKD